MKYWPHRPIAISLSCTPMLFSVPSSMSTGKSSPAKPSASSKKKKPVSTANTAPNAWYSKPGRSCTMYCRSTRRWLCCLVGCAFYLGMSLVACMSGASCSGSRRPIIGACLVVNSPRSHRCCGSFSRASIAMTLQRAPALVVHGTALRETHSLQGRKRIDHSR